MQDTSMKLKTISGRTWWCCLGASLTGLSGAFTTCAAETNPLPQAAAGTNAPPGLAATNAAPAVAATNAPPVAPEPLTLEQMFEGGTNTFSNWIDIGLGGFWAGGNKAQAQARRNASRGGFGGIE